MTGPVRWRPIRLVAGRDLADLRRQRSVWVSLLMLPFINVLFLLLLPGFLTQREQSSLQRATYRVAIGSAGDVEVLRVALPAPRFRLVEEADPRRAVSERRADLGISLHPEAVRALSTDGQAQGDVFVLGARNRSRAAYAVASVALEQYAVDLATTRVTAHGLPPAAARPVNVQRTDLNGTDRGRRLGLGTVLPLIVLLPLTGAVGISAQRISGSKDQRVFEPLLVLPFSRTEVLLGKAASSILLCAITLPAVAVPLLLGRVLRVVRAGQVVALPAAQTAGVVAIAVLLLTLLVSLGVMVGSASRTSAELGSVLQMATLPIFLLGLFLQFRSGIVTRPELLVLPFFGPLLLVRDLAIGALTAAHVLTAAAATATWTLLLLALGVRFVASERTVLRPTN